MGRKRRKRLLENRHGGGSRDGSIGMVISYKGEEKEAIYETKGNRKGRVGEEIEMIK